MNLLQIYFFDTGNAAPLTDYDIKVLKGILLILTVIWMLASIYTIYLYRKCKGKNFLNHKISFWEFYFWQSPISAFHYIMTWLYGVLVIIYGGVLVANLLF